MFAQVCLFAACAVLSVQASCDLSYDGGLGYYGNEYPTAFARPAEAILPAQALLPSSEYAYSGLNSVNPINPSQFGFFRPAEAVLPAQTLLPNIGYESGCAILPTLGPRTPALPVIRTSTVVAPEAPKIVDLPAPPAPPTRVVSNVCSCSKTVVKPQVYERTVRIPSSIKYIKKSYVPVEEKIRYCARGQVGTEASAPGPIVVPRPRIPVPIPSPRPACGCY